MSATLSAPAMALARIAAAAGMLILRHYAAGVEAREKSDHSPVTAADEEAEALILARLAEIEPGVPVVAEEEAARGHVAEIGARFFLVDPLDGTREFLSRNGEFTVNIAEIADGVSVRGVVYAPALGRLFVGETPGGAYEVALADDVPDFATARAIRVRLPPKTGKIAVASRSHRDAKTEDYLAAEGVTDFVSAGSSLKFCLVAAGEADIYPRLGRTMEWDTAAGHAVLAAAGGSVTGLDGAPFLYGKADVGFENPFFVARGL
ncbi:MAG TPA: 3'(2'),5'-bisphosphate nucleotidase CysQ [Rhizomicrobium sp.]